MTELIVPAKTDTPGLAAITQAILAVNLLGSNTQVVTGEVEAPTLKAADGDLVGATAILEHVAKAHDSLVSSTQEVLAPFLEASKKLDAPASAKLAEQLPNGQTPGAVALFGGLHALVSARGRTSISVDAPLVMWYQQFLSIPRVKTALALLSKVQYQKPEANRPSPGGADVVPKESTKALETKLESLKVDTPKEAPKEEVKKESKPEVSAAPETEKTVSEAASDATIPAAAPVVAPTSSAEAAPSAATAAATTAAPSGKATIDESIHRKVQSHPIVPKDGERNILITSALPYVNNVPHLGNIIGSVLSADFYARYAKGRGYNALYICGTDEYGTATETKAIEEGVTPYELCTKYYHIHKGVYEWFQIGFDYFGRTSTEKQTEIAQDIFTKLDNNGYLEEKTTTQLYCTVHNSFLADRFVEGTCPHCKYEDARGDQCDGCGQLLDPLELINPRCKLDNSTPEPRETKHVFISLDKLQEPVEKWIGETSETGHWAKNTRSIANNWLKQGLQPRAITRDLKWGTPIPKEGYEDKVMYVWFDATIGYISITANYHEDYKKWWMNSEDVKLYQFMGKDNVAFHTVLFPAQQIGTKEPWTMLHHISTTEYLQYEGGKFSKSRNLGVFGNNAQEIGISPSVWRYYLATARPETADTQFSWTDFVARNNNELLANLGNLVNRLIKFTNAKYDGVIPEFKTEDLPNYSTFLEQVNEIVKSYIDTMEQVHLREGLEVAMRLSSRGNQFLQDNKIDNTLFTEHPAQCAAVIGVGLNLVYTISALISPFMPATTKQIEEQLEAPPRSIPDAFDLPIKGGHKIGAAQYLFSRIDSAKVEEWKDKYGGEEVAKAKAEAAAKKEAKKAKKAKKSKK